MDLSKIHRIYFIGIGGIGMSALARYFLAGGFEVAGYDRTPTGITKKLTEEGCSIHFEDNPDMIPETFRSFPDKIQTLVIITPAIPSEHREWKFFSENGFTILKRSSVLGWISERSKSIAIAGTHGKTTITAMIAHIMKQSNLDCTAFIGGITKNYQTNLLLGDSEYTVMEADEFDRSFLTLHPFISVISSIDPDHLDIYENENHLQKSFELFAQQTCRNGHLLVKDTAKLVVPEREDLKIYNYSSDRKTDFHASNIQLENGVYAFDVRLPDGEIKDVRLGFPGKVNIENAIAAIGVAWMLGIPHEIIRKALLYFSGIRRRFDIRFKSDKLVYIDDYAHHPVELDSLISSVRDLYPGKKIIGIFQPHLFSRTRDLQKDFAKSLSKLDKLILMEIYPAREEPIEGVTSRLILEEVVLKDKKIISREKIQEEVGKMKEGVILTIGAGDIFELVKPIEEQLKSTQS
jgi:UDP-N-acetylmuramate--alanine ligase